MELTTPIAELIKEQLGRLQIGTARTFGGLTVFPLLSDGPEAAADADPGYLTLDRALEAEVIRISEISEGGSVPTLLLENLGDRPVLLLDGEELAGAKQNRVLNLTILAPANKTITIPVSCVEAGRWRSESRHFSSEDHVMHSLGRREKLAQVSGSLVNDGCYSSNQGAVWASVEKVRRKYDVASPTSKLSDVYRAKRREMDDFVSAFEPVDGQLGAAFVLGGRVRGVELFDRGRTLCDLHGKLVRSWALDAMAQDGQAQDLPSADHVRWVLDEIATAGKDASEHDAIGLGCDVRLSGERLVGSVLAFETRVVHLCAFRTGRRAAAPSDSDGGSRRGPLARLTSRVMPASRRRKRYER